MNAIAWAIVVVGVFAADFAHSYKFGPSYEGAGFLAIVFFVAMIGLIVVSAR